MQTLILSLTATVVSSTKVHSALMNLANHTLLSNNKLVSPLESIAHLATFDEIPVFGGLELRQKMLSAEAERNRATSLFQGAYTSLFKATKVVSC